MGGTDQCFSLTSVFLFLSLSLSLSPFLYLKDHGEQQTYKLNGNQNLPGKKVGGRVLTGREHHNEGMNVENTIR